MEYTLSQFAGRYHCMPDAPIYVLSDNAYVVLLQIYIHSKQVLYGGKIPISLRNLSKLTGHSRSKINEIVNELQELNMLSYADRGKTVAGSFQINWDEIYEIDRFISHLTFEGIEKVRKLMYADDTPIPFTKCDKETLNEIVRDHYLDYKEPVVESKTFSPCINIAEIPETEHDQIPRKTIKNDNNHCVSQNTLSNTEKMLIELMLNGRIKVEFVETLSADRCLEKNNSKM